MKQSENIVQQKIINFLKVRKIFHNRVNNGQFIIKGEYDGVKRKSSTRSVRCNSINGVPDITVYAYAMFQDKPPLHIPIYLEVKTATGRQSKSQKEFQERIGGYYYLVRGIEDVIEAFDKVSQHLKEHYGAKLAFASSRKGS